MVMVTQIALTLNWANEHGMVSSVYYHCDQNRLTLWFFPEVTVNFISKFTIFSFIELILQPE